MEMKRVTSMLVAILVLVSSIVIPTGIFAADAEPTMLFEMGLGLTDNKPVVTNIAGGDAVSSITFGKNQNDNANQIPLYGVEERYGASEPYLDFAYDAVTTRSESQVNLFMKDKAFGNKDEISIELWLCEKGGDTRQNKPLFALGSNAQGAGVEGFVVQLDSASKVLAIYFDKFKSNIMPSNLGEVRETGPKFSYTLPEKYTDNWTHYVITMKWTPNSEDNYFGAGKWTPGLYINGEIPAGANLSAIEATERPDYTDIWKSDLVTNIVYDRFMIAGNSYTDPNRAFPGRISRFRIYDGIVNEATAKEHYMAERQNYMYLNYIKNTNLFDLGRDDTEFTIAFDKAVNVNTLDTVKVFNYLGKPINIRYKSYDPETCIATFNLIDYLVGGEEYSLYFKEVTDINGTTLRQTNEYTNNAKAETGLLIDRDTVTLESGTVTLPISVTPGTTGKVAMGVVVYGENNKIKIDGVYLSEEVVITENDTNKTLTVPGIVLEAGDYIKTYAWAVEGAGLLPIVAPIKIEQ